MKKIISAISVFILCSTCIPTKATTIDGRFYPVFIPNQNNSIHTTASKTIDNLVGNFDHKITTVFSDIDGTIIPFNKTAPKGIVPESAKQGAEKLRQANIPLILATGRPSGEGRQIAKKMGNENTYIIAQQGAEIVSPEGKLIYEDAIKNKDAKKMIKEITSFNKSHNQDSKILVYNEGKLYMTEKYQLPYLFDEAIVIKSFDNLPSKYTPVKIGLCDTNINNLRLIQSHLKRKFPKYHVDISADCYCDISSGTATKGNAIKKLANMLNIDLANSAVIGDAENDISMLKLIREKNGLSIAVGNAMDKVKNNAEYVTTDSKDGGWAKAIDKILLNNAALK